MMVWSIVDARGAIYGPFDSLWSLAKLVECTEMFHPLVAVQTLNSDPRPVCVTIVEALEKARPVPTLTPRPQKKAHVESGKADDANL